MIELLKDPKVIAAIIAALTSLFTLFLLKPFVEKRFLKFKLNEEHKYDQRKRIKDVLAKNKTQLINSAEQLNHRLWNFRENYSENWHSVSGDYFNQNNYYFNSFIYRILAFYAWLRVIDKQMIYLDTTIASKDDLNFIKYLQVFPQIMCDSSLFKGFEFDQNSSKDHFFRNDFEDITLILVNGDTVAQYSDYFDSLSDSEEQYTRLCLFIDGLSPDEKRLRFDRLQLLHLAILAFLNKYGYDFQYTEKEKVKSILDKPRKSKLLKNYSTLIERAKLQDEKEMKTILKVIKNYI